MNRALYEDKRRYVDGLNTHLAPMQDFDYIKYARSAITAEEYIKIADKIGGYVFIDVTASTTEDILKDVSRVVLNGELDGKHMPKGVITDKAKLRAIAPLFA